MLSVSHPARDTRRLLGGKREQMAHFALAKSCQGASRRSRAEHRSEAVCRMAVLTELIGVEGQCQPAADVVTERHCAQQRRAASSFALRHRQGSGDNAAAGMSQRRRMRVVGFVGVREHAVGQCGVYDGRNEVTADHRCFFDPAEGFDIGDGFHARRETRSGNHCRDGIEDVVLGLFDHRRRERPAQCRCNVGAQPAHDG